MLLLSGLDDYRVLELQPGAAMDEVERSYRRLIRIHHPDAGGTTEKAAQINDAYQALRRLLLANETTLAAEARPPIETESEAAPERPHESLIQAATKSVCLLVAMRVDFASRWLVLRPQLVLLRVTQRERLRRSKQSEFEEYWWARYSELWDSYRPLPSRGRRGPFDFSRSRLFEGLRF